MGIGDSDSGKGNLKEGSVFTTIKYASQLKCDSPGNESKKQARCAFLLESPNAVAII